MRLKDFKKFSYFEYIFEIRKSPFLYNLIIENFSTNLCDKVFIFNQEKSISCVISIFCELSDEIRIKRELAGGIADSIANIISWEFAVPMKFVRYKEREKMDFELNKNTFETSDKIQKNLKRYLSHEAQDTFAVYRQAKNERNRALRYFMFYRLLESLIGSKKSIDNFINKKFNNEIIFVPNHRFKNKKESLISHFRNHIHPNKLLFPYKRFFIALPKLETVLRSAIKETLKFK